MRNLKRALSLALASVMLLGMMVVGTSAASYPDVDENDNVEAIEVLNAVDVMIGRQGNFEPDEAVNRHEMAVIMAKLVLGVDTADSYVGTHPFTDVVPWADKYVAACYENDLISGTSATTYSGSQPLTAVQAALMMLRALGYKDLNKGYQGDWRAPITAMANQIRLFNGVANNPNDKLNRNQVAQLALNTLKSPMVNLKDNTISWSNNEGQIIMTGGSREYIVLSSQESYAKAINDVESKGTSASAIGGYTVELGEHLYNGKLKLNNYDQDVFGRPSRTWEYDGKQIGTYAKEELLDKEYVGKVTGKDLYDLLGNTILGQNSDYDVYCYIDGLWTDRDGAKAALGYVSDSKMGAYFNRQDMNRNNKAAVGGTGTGTVTEVYVDHDKDVVYVVVVNTYLAIASKDYDTKKEETPITVYSIKAAASLSDEYVKDPQPTSSSRGFDLAVEDFPGAVDIKKDDALLVTVAEGEIQSYQSAEVLSGVTLSAFKLNDKVVTGGTTYNYTTTAAYKNGDDINQDWTTSAINNLKDRTYNIYLDQFGNLIGIKEIEAKKNYVFIAGIDLNSSNLANKTADASAIFLDGTMESIKVNMTKSEFLTVEKDDNDSILNTWCTYSKSGDVYTVKEVVTVDGATGNGRPGISYVEGGVTKTNSTNLAQYNQTKSADFKIDAKNYRLSGGALAVGDSYSSVYGDNDTVYLTAKLGELAKNGNTANTNYGIVKDVVSVTTGIENANLTVWSDANARLKAEDDKVKPGTVGPNNCSSGVYTLYNDKGIIIAAMVVGEDAGVAKDLVYVTSSGMNLEEDNGSAAKAAGDGLWTWYRDVVRDGEIVTLKEVGDDSSYAKHLRQMDQYHWYQIRTNADGYVIDATEAGTALDKYPGKTGASLYVTDYSKINDAVEESGTDLVLYLTNGGPDNAGFGAGNELKVEGNNTLAVTNQLGSGIHFRKDVNVVLQYWNKNTKEQDVMTGEGVDDLKDMVKIVNGNSTVRGTSTYYVSALIDRGFATTIVIYDSYNSYKRPGGGTTVTGSAKMDFDKDTGVWTLNVPTTQAKADALKITEIRDYLLDAGCTEIKNNGTQWSFVWEDIPAEKVTLKIVGTETNVPATGVTLSDETKTIAAGASFTLTATVTPANTTDKTVWTSSNDSVATVSSTGTVTGVNAGTATITAQAGKASASCTVTVTKGGEEVALKLNMTTADNSTGNGYINITKNGSHLVENKNYKASVIGTISEGDVINIQPAAVFTVNGEPIPASGNVDVKGDITIAPKATYSFDPFFRQWGVGGVVNRSDVVSWNLAALSANVLNTAAKRFSIARAADGGLVDPDAGEKDLKWQTNDNWFADAILGNFESIELRAYVGGKLAIQVIVIGDTTISRVMSEDSEVTEKDFADFINNQENWDEIKSVGVPDDTTKFTVTVNTDKNSTGAADKENYDEGDKAVVKITVDEGYRLLKVMDGETDVTSQVKWREADGVYEYTIDSMSDDVVVDVTTEEIPDNLYLNLSGNLFDVAKAGTGVVVYAGKAVQGDEVVDNGSVVMQYAIPEGTEVLITCEDTKLFDADDAGAIVGRSGTYYKVGGTLIFADSPNRRQDEEGHKVNLSFTMSENITLDMKTSGNVEDATEVMLVETTGGVELELTPNNAKQTEKVTVVANDVTEVPVLENQQGKTAYWTVKVTDAGEGNFVGMAVNGTDRASSTFGCKVKGEALEGNDFGWYAPSSYTVFESCYKIDAGTNAKVEGDVYWRGTKNGDKYDKQYWYVPVGHEITVKFAEDISHNNGLDEYDFDGYVVLTADDYANGDVIVSKSDLVAEGETITVNAKMNIYPAVKFTLGEGVTAKYEYMDAFTGKVVTTETLTEGVWYGGGAFPVGMAVTDNPNKDKKLQLTGSLIFDQENVMNAEIAAKATKKIDTSEESEGTPVIKSGADYVSDTYLAKSYVWDGAKFETWIVVETTDIDEIYMWKLGVEIFKLCDDAYSLTEAGADQKIDMGVDGMNSEATVKGTEGMFLLNPDAVKMLDGDYDLCVIGGNGTDINEGKNIAADKYDIAMNDDVSSDDSNPFGIGTIKTAFGNFKTIEVVDGIVTLKAVEKAAN